MNARGKVAIWGRAVCERCARKVDVECEVTPEGAVVPMLGDVDYWTRKGRVYCPSCVLKVES